METWQQTNQLVNKLNRTLRGWANPYRAIDNYILLD
jgi:hypothetical protein